LEASYFIGSEKSIVANKIIICFDYINFLVNMMYALAVWFITDKSDTFDKIATITRKDDT
jgi:uncharacterized membrane protein (GlpM family)